jgi:hypothetical protein
VKRLWVLLSFLFIVQTASAQILVDETWGGGRLGTTSSSFSSVSSLRKTKKLGLQTTVAGAAGLLGLNMEVNLNENFAISMGPGVSRGFRSFNAHVKKFMGGNRFSPYFVGGFSRWYSSAREEGVESTTPEFVEKKFLTGRERRTGKFAENIIYPGLGLQYLKTSGDWSGLGFFGEILFLVDIDDLETSPTAGVGSIFYF